jgi:low affinity Fe/Cu permease
MAHGKSAAGRWLQRFAQQATVWSGSSAAFLIAVGIVLVWLATGPIFDYSNTWQLVINTGTTIVTFVMVFLIQRAQNKESQALQLKLNELIAAVEGASNRLMNVEDMSEEQIRRLHRRYRELARLHKHESRTACSVEEVVEGRADAAHLGSGHPRRTPSPGSSAGRPVPRDDTTVPRGKTATPNGDAR